jgi:hypothetical protein
MSRFSDRILTSRFGLRLPNPTDQQLREFYENVESLNTVCSRKAEQTRDLIEKIPVIAIDNVADYYFQESDGGKSWCAHRSKLDTDSGGSWTPIPVQAGHPFQLKLDTRGFS